MPGKLTPYLHFQDTARAAMEFYQSVFGGQLNVSTFADYQVSEDPAEANKIMHAQLDTTHGLTLMGADTPNAMLPSDGTAGAANISLALSGEDKAEFSGYFEKLAVGGVVEQPLGDTPWGDTYGSLTDRFGIQWMVNINQPRG